MKHEMKLNDLPFNKIKVGTKKIELRLNDEKRQKIKVLDKIEFTNRTTNEKMLVGVTDLFKYKDFEELYKNFTKEELGYSKDEDFSYKDMENYYSKEEINKYGVLGIKIRKI